jgi:hypothetical protein
VIRFLDLFEEYPGSLEFLEFDTKKLMDGKFYSDSYLDLPRTGKDTFASPVFSIVGPIGKIMH